MPSSLRAERSNPGVSALLRFSMSSRHSKGRASQIAYSAPDKVLLIDDTCKINLGWLLYKKESSRTLIGMYLKAQ
jgi:hypothetical protein